MKPLIEIAPVPGRIAFTAPTGGKQVTGPVKVRRSPWVSSLIEAGDVEEVKKRPAPAPAIATAEGARANGKKS